MNEDFLDDEHSISEARKNREAQDVLALHEPIGDLTELHSVVSIEKSTILSDAVKMMVEKRVGCLLVTENEKIVGLFTERDLLRNVADNIDTGTTPISTLMTPNPETLPIDSPLVFALQRMSVGGYRHVPLVNDEGKPVAIVSMRDIVEHIVSLYPNQVLNLPEQPGNWSKRDGA